MLGDDHSHIEGSGDVKSSVVMVAIGDFIFTLLALDLFLYIEGYLYILYITLQGGPPWGALEEPDITCACEELTQ